MVCALARLGGARTLKTGTGLVRAAPPLMSSSAHRIVGGDLSIEAAGEIDCYARLREMMAAGATEVATARASDRGRKRLDARRPVTQNH